MESNLDVSRLLSTPSDVSLKVDIYQAQDRELNGEAVVSTVQQVQSFDHTHAMLTGAIAGDDQSMSLIGDGGASGIPEMSNEISPLVAGSPLAQDLSGGGLLGLADTHATRAALPDIQINSAALANTTSNSPVSSFISANSGTFNSVGPVNTSTVNNSTVTNVTNVTNIINNPPDHCPPHECPPVIPPIDCGCGDGIDIGVGVGIDIGTIVGNVSADIDAALHIGNLFCEGIKLDAGLNLVGNITTEVVSNAVSGVVNALSNGIEHDVLTPTHALADNGLGMVGDLASSLGLGNVAAATNDLAPAVDSTFLLGSAANDYLADTVTKLITLPDTHLAQNLDLSSTISLRDGITLDISHAGNIAVPLVTSTLDTALERVDATTDLAKQALSTVDTATDSVTHAATDLLNPLGLGCATALLTPVNGVVDTAVHSASNLLDSTHAVTSDLSDIVNHLNTNLSNVGDIALALTPHDGLSLNVSEALPANLLADATGTLDTVLHGNAAGDTLNVVNAAVDTVTQTGDSLLAPLGLDGALNPVECAVDSTIHTIKNGVNCLTDALNPVTDGLNSLSSLVSANNPLGLNFTPDGGITSNLTHITDGLGITHGIAPLNDALTAITDPLLGTHTTDGIFAAAMSLQPLNDGLMHAGGPLLAPLSDLNIDLSHLTDSIGGGDSGLGGILSSVGLDNLPIIGGDSGLGNILGSGGLDHSPIIGTDGGLGNILGAGSLDNLPILGGDTGLGDILGSAGLDNLPIVGGDTGLGNILSCIGLDNLPICGTDTGLGNILSPIGLDNLPIIGGEGGLSNILGSGGLDNLPIVGGDTGLGNILGSGALDNLPIVGSDTGLGNILSPIGLDNLPIGDIGGQGDGLGNLLAGISDTVVHTADSILSPLAMGDIIPSVAPILPALEPTLGSVIGITDPSDHTSLLTLGADHDNGLTGNLLNIPEHLTGIDVSGISNTAQDWLNAITDLSGHASDTSSTSGSWLDAPIGALSGNDALPAVSGVLGSVGDIVAGASQAHHALSALTDGLKLHGLWS